MREGWKAIEADQPFDAVDDPRHLAHTGDDLAVREQCGKCWQSRAPAAAGIEHHVRLRVGVVLLEQAAKDALAPGVVDEHRELVAETHLAQQCAEQAGQWPAHAGMEVRVLAQQGSQQRRARAREPGDEMDAFEHEAPYCVLGDRLIPQVGGWNLGSYGSAGGGTRVPPKSGVPT